MQGHIKKRGKNSWTVVVELGRDPETRKRRQLWRSVKGTKRDAEAFLVQLLNQRDTGIDVPPGKLTVREYLQSWLNDHARVNLAPKTFRTYADIVRLHLIPALGRMPLTKLRPQHIQGYYARALRTGRIDGRGGLSPQSVVHHHHVLHAALRRAVKWQLLSRNPIESVEPPKVRRQELRALSPEELARLLAAADRSDSGPLVRVALLTGLRQGELLGLRWADLDLDRGVLRVQQTAQWLPGQGVVFRPPKTAKSRRSVALSKETVRTLREVRRRQLEDRLKLGPAYQEHDLVFATSIGTPIDPSNLRRTWLYIISESGVGHLRFHDLRHAHASLMLQQGVHPKVVSERLGHAGIAITLDTYSHVMPSIQEEAAAKLDVLIPRAR